MATETKTVKLSILHRCHDRRTAHWVQPIDWTPQVPEEFRREGFTLDEGSIWGQEEEEAGLVYFGEAEEGDTIEAAIGDLNWVYTNTSGLQRLDDPFVKIEGE